MTQPDPEATLLRSLQQSRDAVLGKVDGLSEYDARRPLTPTAPDTGSATR